MSGEIVNLNKARKAKAKAEASERAKVNRARHGQTTAQRFKAKLEAMKADRALDGKRRDTETSGEDT